MTASQFERVAEVVADRAAELFCTEVSIIDAGGSVVASRKGSASPALPDVDPDGSRTDVCRGSPGWQPERSVETEYVRVPLQLHGETGEVRIAAPRNGEVISPRLAQVLAELIIDQTAVVDRLPNKHELKNKFIHDLLQGSIRDEAGLGLGTGWPVREAQILGMDLTHPRVVILIDATDYILASGRHESLTPSDARVWRRAQLIIGSIVDFFELPNDTICAYIGVGEIAVLKSTYQLTWLDHADEPSTTTPSWANLDALKRAGGALLTRLCRDTRSDVSIGIGRYHPGLRGLAASYEDARAALSLGRRFHGHNRVHCLDSLGIAAFVGVSDEHTKIDLARYLLSPLDHEPELLATLDAFFSHDCCPSTTAQSLSIHRNTLSYRLDKVASLTGLDPRHFDDAVQIRLALILRSLQSDPPGRQDDAHHGGHMTGPHRGPAPSAPPVVPTEW